MEQLRCLDLSAFKCDQTRFRAYISYRLLIKIAYRISAPCKPCCDSPAAMALLKQAVKFITKLMQHDVSVPSPV